MAGDVSMRFVSDVAQLLADHDKMVTKEEKLRKSTTDTAKAIAKRRKEQQAMAREAVKLENKTATPLERYKKRLKEIEQLRKKGLIGEEAHRRAAVLAWKESGLASIQAEKALKKEEAERAKVIAVEKRQSESARRRARYEAELGRRQKQILREIETPQDRYNAKMRELDRLLRRGKLSQGQYAAAVRKTKADLRAAGDAGNKAFGRPALTMLTTLTGAVGLGSVAGALATIVASYDKWIEKTREVSEETKKAANQIIAFAALQEGGKKAARVKQAADLAASYGVMDRGEAFNTVQAMQSVYGSWEKGLKASETIFAATNLGIDLSKAREIEVMGAMQGAEPGGYLRRAYVAGEQSGRTPEAIIGGAEGFKNWDDKDFGFAAAAVLSGNIKEDKLGVYMKRAGMSLSKAGASQEYFEGLGMGDSTRAERIAELAKRGLDDQVELTEIGIKEVREREAVSDLVRNYKEILRVQGVIKSNAKPGLLVKERAEVEAELPTTAMERITRKQQARYENELAFGPQAMPAMIEEIKQRSRGAVYTRMGLRSWGPWSIVGEGEKKGMSTLGDQLQAGFAIQFGGGNVPEDRGTIKTEHGYTRDVSRPLYGALEVQRQQYLDLTEARQAIRSDGAATPTLDRVLRELENGLKKWSEWAEIQKQVTQKTEAAADKMNEAADKTAEVATKQAQPPNPAVSHGDHD